MKILADGTRIPESWEERRRLEQELQDLIDEAEADLLRGLYEILGRTVVGDGYIATAVYEGACVVSGCRREARTFCDEHQDPANRPDLSHGPLRADS